MVRPGQELRHVRDIDDHDAAALTPFGIVALQIYYTALPLSGVTPRRPMYYLTVDPGPIYDQSPRAFRRPMSSPLELCVDAAPSIVAGKAFVRSPLNCHGASSEDQLRRSPI